MQDLTEQITREFEIEHRGNPKAFDADDIPISYEAITPEWLTHILCKNHTGAKVNEFRLDVPDEGNTNRRRVYITYNEAGKAAGLPTSVFCKAAHRLANRLVLANCGLTQGEVSFYNDFRPFLDIEAPTPIFATFSPRTYNSIIMLDDLVRHGAEFCKHNTKMTSTRAESQLSLLAKLHGKYYQKMEESPLTAKLRTFEQTFNFSNSWFNLEECCNNGFEAAEEVVPPRLFKRRAEIWPATLKSVDVHRSQPRTLTHTDTHLRNWYIAPDGQMGLTDWQGIASGDWGRDVAYAISTALAPEDRRVWEKELLRFYLDRLHAQGCPKLDFSEVWDNYRRHLFASLAWWTVTLTPSSGDSDVPPPDFQPRDATLEFIKRISTAIDDLDALNSFD